jgi:hypothetical protein
MSQLISRQEPTKRKLQKLTLHEFLCYEAEPVVKYNFCDVAVWDKRIIENMRPGEVRLWCIHELGSQLLPLFCRTAENKNQVQRNYEFSSVEILMLKLMRDDGIYAYQNKIMRETAQFYFVTPGCGDYDYMVKKSNLREIVDLVFCGKANHLLTQS